MRTLNSLFILLLLALMSYQNRSPKSLISYTFPQGVASADPQPDAITLWTRVVRNGNDTTSIPLKVEMALRPGFQEIVLSNELVANAKDDFTVRYYADKLENGKKYFFRFIAGEDTSVVGRTFTAPDNETVATLNFASLACSSYEQGFYGTLKRLIEEDKAKPAEDQLQVIFHLGDFIYEVVGDDPRNDNHYPKWLVAANGKERAIAPFPKGKQRPDNGHWKSGSWNPITVEDYRHLYKIYLSNPVMQEARARWPFIYTWDDHEFVDGGVQSIGPEAKTLGLEGMQEVKVAANQAWFEYLPATLSNGSSFDGVENPAHDFKFVQVKNAVVGPEKENGLFKEPNNLMAINSMCIYRALQWGKEILILVPDTKSYQDPGKSVLGQKQKDWFQQLLLNSPAKWKLWANSEPILKATIDLDNLPEVDLERTLIYSDSWKKADTEREEILQFIKKNQINGVVSLSGDYHIQMAATVSTKDGTPVMADFAVTAMSSFADFFWLERKGRGFKNETIYSLFAFEDDKGYLLPNINTTAVYGAKAALAMAQTNDFNKALLLADSSINGGLQYFDCEHNGYLTIQVSSDKMEIEFTNTENARNDYEATGAPLISKVYFDLPAWERGAKPVLSEPKIEGIVFPYYD